MIKSKNKRMQNAYQDYLRSKYQNIYQAYITPSENKVEAYESCERLCKEYKGHDLKVVSKNIYKFTAGFIGEVDGKKAFVYITDTQVTYMFLE